MCAKPRVVGRCCTVYCSMPCYARRSRRDAHTVPPAQPSQAFQPCRLLMPLVTGRALPRCHTMILPLVVRLTNRRSESRSQNASSPCSTLQPKRQQTPAMIHSPPCTCNPCKRATPRARSIRHQTARQSRGQHTQRNRSLSSSSNRSPPQPCKQQTQTMRCSCPGPLLRFLLLQLHPWYGVRGACTRLPWLMAPARACTYTTQKIIGACNHD
jgi:hypothetical protein